VSLPRRRRLRLAENRLRAAVPAKYPVVVVYEGRKRKGRVLKGALAQCEVTQARPKAFILRIRSGQSHTALMDALIHEWAHSLTPRNADHGPAWGLAYARCYRAAMGVR
jgi:hypothetical protein